VKGAYNLHKLTLNFPLEHFVVHSSMTCTLGHVGQSNYAAGNAYMEALVEKRHLMGLPALSISWGTWKAGLAENKQVDQFTPFTKAQGIATLEKLLLEARESVASGFINLEKVLDLAPFYEKTLLEKVLKLEKTGNQNQNANDHVTKIRLKEIYSKAKGEEEKERIVRDFIKNGISKTLGIPFQDIRDDVGFSVLGMDSLLSIEFYNRLQSEMGEVDLGYVDMEKDGSVEKMSKIIRTAFDKHLA